MPAPATATKSPAAKKEDAFALPAGLDMQKVSKEAAVSGAMGAAVGVAAHRLTSDALYGAGMCFAGLQCLAYCGLITIHWNVISDAVEKAADQNKDGKLDTEDVKIFWRRCMTYLSRGVPSAAGFTSGFIFGYKYLA
ncbi:FUN14 family [Lotmaria passim]